MNDLQVNKKASNDKVTSFLIFLADFETATPNSYKDNQTLNNLAYLLGNDKLKRIDTDILINDSNQPTHDSIGVMLFDEHYQVTNLAIYPLDNRQPFLLNGFNNDCFIFGNGGQVIAVNDLDTAFLLYPYINQNNDYTILAPFNTWQFDSIVKAHASHSQVMIFTDYETSLEYQKTFKDDHVKIIATVDILDDLILDYSLDEIINDPNKEPRLQTKVIELGGLDWGELEPLRDTVIINNPYPIQAFSSDLQAVINKTSYYMQVPQSVAGQAVLGALSTMCQSYVNAPFGFSHNPSSIYLITQLDSGDGKTQANKFIYRQINEIDKAKGKDYREKLESYQAELASIKPKERASYILDNPPPKDETFLISKSTLQFILHKFIVGKSYNLSLASGEAGQFFGGYSMNLERIGETASELANIYSGEPVEYKTLGNQKDGNNLKAYDVRLTIDILGQPIIFKTVFNNPLLMKQGFLARFLVSFEPSMAGKRIYNDKKRISENPYQDKDMIKFWDRCKAFYDRVPSDNGIDIDGTPKRFNMPFGDGAMQYLNDYRQICENRLLNEFTDFKETAKRLAENASRIATLMAYFDGLDKLPIAYLEKGIMLAEYSINELMRYNAQTQASEKNDTERLIDWIVKRAKDTKQPKLNRTFIANNCPSPIQCNTKLLGYELDKLEGAGYIRQEKEGRKNVVLINPQLLK